MQAERTDGSPGPQSGPVTVPDKRQSPVISRISHVSALSQLPLVSRFRTASRTDSEIGARQAPALGPEMQLIEAFCLINTVLV